MMSSHELVTRAIEFRHPERLPFFQHKVLDIPDDVCDCWEMDRQKRGWFFDNPAEDDWGCGWESVTCCNMGQVVHHPLADWSAFDKFLPPDPRDDFYYSRIDPVISAANERYVVLGAHFNLIERHHMLRGFDAAMLDYYLEPEKTHRILDMILEFRVRQFEEAAARFGNRVHGFFLTDDWGTQQGPFVDKRIFEEFFLERYRWLVNEAHSHKYHIILHSCGRVNDLLPYFIEAGVDVMNMQQPQAYGIKELGEMTRGKIAFLATADIQSTLPQGNPDEIRAEVREIIEHWSTPAGGVIAFDYGKDSAVGTDPAMAEIMFDAFREASRELGKPLAKE